MFESINPFDGTVIDSHPADRPKTIEEKLARAQRAYVKRGFTFEQRKAFVLRVAQLLNERKAALANLMALEMGKPLTQGQAEIDKCVRLCTEYVDHADEWLADEIIENAGQRAWVRHDPIGVILGIMPWNYPFWQVFRFVIPALLAGNTCLLKHASNVCGCARELVKLFSDAGVPDGWFDALYISGAQASALVADDRIAGVSLTGSEAAGVAVGKAAGAAIKPIVLELGGNNAFIVLDDAAVDHAVETFFNARFQNTGQSCIAAKRLLIHTSVYNDFLDALTGRMSELQPQNPLLESTFIGPMARKDLAEELQAQMHRSVNAGANLVCGGALTGACFSPALLVDVEPGMAAFDEETFGPLAAVSRFSSLDEAIILSNKSRFGLGVSLFTQDVEAVLPRLLEFNEGAVFLNDLVYSHPLLPFGGVKKSGVGRELGRDGIRSFVNRKTVVVAG